jgi:hypothetical protein
MTDESLQTLQVALECWAKFGLNARRSTLDAQAARIAESQDASVKSRRELTEHTKVRPLCIQRQWGNTDIVLGQCKDGEETEWRRANRSNANVVESTSQEKSSVWGEHCDDDALSLCLCFKAYQAEIDSLTRRSKQAEDAFLAMYQSLAT